MVECYLHEKEENGKVVIKKVWKKLRNEDPPKIECSYKTFCTRITEYENKINNDKIYDAFPKTPMEEEELSLITSFDSSKIVISDKVGVSLFANNISF